MITPLKWSSLLLTKLPQIADAPHPIRDVYDTHCLPLVQSFRVHQLDYSCCMVTVAFSSVVNPDEVPLSEAFENSAWHRVLKQELDMAFVNGRSPGKAILKVHIDNGPQWSRNSIRHVWHQCHQGGRYISTAKAVKLGKVAK